MKKRKEYSKSSSEFPETPSPENHPLKLQNQKTLKEEAALKEKEACEAGVIGYGYKKDENWPEAIKYYDKALKAYEDILVMANASEEDIESLPIEHGDTLNHLAGCYEELGNLNEARRCYKRTMEVDPESDTPFKWFGLQYKQSKNWSEAIKYYEQALKLSDGVRDWGSSGETLMNLKECYVNLKSWPKATYYSLKALNNNASYGTEEWSHYTKNLIANTQYLINSSNSIKFSLKLGKIVEDSFGEAIKGNQLVINNTKMEKDVDGSIPKAHFNIAECFVASSKFDGRRLTEKLTKAADHYYKTGTNLGLEKIIQLCKPFIKLDFINQVYHNLGDFALIEDKGDPQFSGKKYEKAIGFYKLSIVSTGKESSNKVIVDTYLQMDHCYEFIKHEVNERAYYQLEVAKYLPLVYKELKDFFTGSMPTLYELIFSSYAGDDALQYTLDNNTVMDELLGDLPTLVPTE